MSDVQVVEGSFGNFLNQSGQWAVALIQTGSKWEKFVGIWPEEAPHRGDKLYFVGEYKDHPRFGLQFAFTLASKDENILEVMNALIGELELSAKLATQAYQCWGSEAIAKINENPYLMFTELGQSFSEVDKVALSQFEIKPNSRIRIGAVIVDVLERELKMDGHCAMPIATVVAKVHEVVNSKSTPVPRETIEKRMRKISDVVITGKYIQLIDIAENEMSVAYVIQQLVGRAESSGRDVSNAR